MWAVNGSSVPGVFTTGGGDATVKVWAPTCTSSAEENASYDDVEDKRLADRGHIRWDCVGGVRGTVGAVGAVLMTEEALLFGTSEAIIATFPLQSCMPGR